MTDIKNEDLEKILKRYVTSIAIEIKFHFYIVFVLNWPSSKNKAVRRPISLISCIVSS